MRHKYRNKCPIEKFLDQQLYTGFLRYFMLKIYKIFTLNLQFIEHETKLAFTEMSRRSHIILRLNGYFLNSSGVKLRGFQLGRDAFAANCGISIGSATNIQ